MNQDCEVRYSDQEKSELSLQRKLSLPVHLYYDSLFGYVLILFLL